MADNTRFDLSPMHLRKQDVQGLLEILHHFTNSLKKPFDVICTYDKRATIMEFYGAANNAFDWPLMVTQTAMPEEIKYDIRRWEPQFRDYDEGLRLTSEELKALIGRLELAVANFEKPESEANGEPMGLILNLIKNDLTMNRVDSTINKLTPPELLQKGLECELGQSETGRNLAKAALYYSKAAHAGHPVAQCGLGYFFENALGGLRYDIKQAVSLYELAAAHGNVAALYHLGRCYEQGLGVSQDAACSLAYYKKAAENGHSGAQCKLGIMHENGLNGAPLNTQIAQYYYSLAAAQDNTLAKIKLQNMVGD
jgi:hypothetical protein